MRFLLDAASRPPFFLHALETANKVLMCSVESLPGTVNVGKKVIHHYKSKEEKTLHAHLYKLHRTGEKKKKSQCQTITLSNHSHITHSS